MKKQYTLRYAGIEKERFWETVGERQHRTACQKRKQKALELLNTLTVPPQTCRQCMCISKSTTLTRSNRRKKEERERVRPFSPATSGSLAVCVEIHVLRADTTSDLPLLAADATQPRALPRTLHTHNIRDKII